ncbi:MAG: hypothetical protein CMB33_00185 [Euryarchaeota archaeon]|nr:hypothetical protein [Euryarchaeota archaeon]
MNKIAPGTIFRLLSVSMLLIASSFVYLNSESINDAISSSVETRDGNESSLVGLADEEFWPVLRVSFPAKPFPNSLLGGLFEGNYSAEQYISEMSGGDSKLKTTIVGETWASPYLESHWGTDSVSERDTGSDSGGVRELAREAIISTFQNQDISQWDLDGDFIVDRLLILHSGQAQEEGGPSTSIWSHFSAFYDPVVVGEYTFEHYTMASVHGGLGVLVHEMLHQMGAVDLYDVHSDAPTRNWHGLGDWDIMASGNWIEDGSRPTLPSSSTLDLIGAIDPIQPSLTSDGNFSLEPLSHGGNPLKIEIAPQEYVWITLRSNTGFDMGLPGHGILVEQQDLNFGDVSSNLVNTDPIKPWVKIVEADGDDALLRARDYGSAGDVFDVGDRFGHTGQKIWDNHGRLVQWTATVIDISDSFATIEFDFIGDANSTVTVPRNPIVVLSDEPIVVDIYSIDECKVVVDISSTGDVAIPPHDGNSTRIKLIEITNSSSNKGTIEGNIGCKDRPKNTVSIDWIVVNHRLSTDNIVATVPWDSDSTIALYPESLGSGPRTYSITIEGAAGRIAEPLTNGLFYPGDPIELRIAPDGLLEPRMIAKGELVILDSDNIEQRIPFQLTAEGDLPFGPLNWLAIPSNAISTVLILMALSLATGNRQNKKISA